jgi:NtrC-family two-component system sensor histidine kinase KinB
MDWVTAVDGLLGLANLVVVFWLTWAVYRQQKGLAEKLFLGMVMTLSFSVVRHVLEVACKLAESVWLSSADAGLSKFFHDLWPVDIAALVIFVGLSLHFVLVFPRPSSLLRRWPRLPYLAYAPGLALAGMMLTRLWLSDSDYLAFWRLGSLGDDTPQLAFVVVVMGLAVSRWIYVTLSDERPLVRRRMRGLLAGALVAVVVATSTDYVPDVLGLPVIAGQVPGLRQLPGLIFFSSFVWTIQRHRILDVRLVLNRSLVYTVLSGALMLSYLFLTSIATVLLQQQMGSLPKLAAPLVAALVIVVGAIPLRDAVQRLVDRLFYGQTQDYREVLREHSRQLTALMSSTALMTQILDLVEAHLRPQGIVIALRQGETFVVRTVKGQVQGIEIGAALTLPVSVLQRLQEEGEPVSLEPDVGGLERMVSEWSRGAANLEGISLIVPFVGPEALIGWMGLRPRQNKSPYALRQHQFLTTLANQSCVALQNAELYEKMRRKASELTVLNAVSTAITSSLDLDEVLQTIANSVISIVGCQKMAIYVLDETQQVVNLAMSRGLSEAFVLASQGMSLSDNLRTTTIVSGQPLTAPDIRDAPGFVGIGELMAQEGIRAMAEVPLWGREGTIGNLAVYYTARHHFTTEEMESLITLATQAAIALENARLYAMTDQALARRVEELSVVETINRELAATLDFERVVGTVLRRAIEATGAPYGLIGMMDDLGTGLRLLTYEGYAPEVIEPFRGRSWPLTQGIISRAIRLVTPMLVADVRRDPDYVSIKADVRSHLSVPIVEGERVLGAVVLESPVYDAFNVAQVDFVSQFFKFAATAIENARRYMQAQQHIGQLSSLQQFGLQVVSSLHLQAVLDAVAESALKLVRANDVHIFFYDEDKDELVFRAGLWASGERPEGVPPVRRHGLTFTVAHSGEPMVIDDTLTHPLFTPPERWRSGTGAIAGFPLKHAGQVLGVFNVAYTVPHTFTDDELRVLTLLSSQAATAIANARLFQQVAEGRDRMEAVLNSVREGILMMDLQDRIVIANPTVEEMLEIPRSQLVGRTLPEVAHDHQERVGWLLDMEDVWRTSAVLGRADGQACDAVKDVVELTCPRRRFLERVIAPVEDRIGTLLGRVVVLRDTTEEKELERMREDLSDMIVHDLRAPLAAIINGSALLQEVFAGQEVAADVSSMLSIIVSSSQRMLDLVNSLLDISRMEAGRLTLDMEPFDLLNMVKQVVARLQPLSASHGIQTEIAIPPDFPWLWGDREKIGRVFTNLLDNAIKFTPRGGQVRISAEANGSDKESVSGLAICSVLDTGPGIPTAHRERIFEKFVQLSSPRSAEEPEEQVRGSGIGLNFCKSAVEAHGGRIWVEEGLDGRGSNFKFTLPLADGSELEAGA